MSIFSNSTEVADREAKNKIYGVVIGIVTQNKEDKNHTYRVKVRFPWLAHSEAGASPSGASPSGGSSGGSKDDKYDESWWARVASFMAGEYIVDDNSLGQRGAFFMPEIGDEVLVAFEHGDISRPIVIGRLWSDVGPEASGGEGKPNRPVYSHTETKGKLALAVDGEKDDPHAKSKHDKGANDLSGIRTRAGHTLVFNDNKEEPAIYLRSAKHHRIELVDGGNQGILIADPKGNYIWLKSDKQNGDIEMFTAGKIKMTAKQDIVLESTEGNITTKSKKATQMDSGSTLDIKSSGAMTLQSSSTAELKASNSLTLTGSQININ